jgi:hypothetical protein
MEQWPDEERYLVAVLAGIAGGSAVLPNLLCQADDLAPLHGLLLDGHAEQVDGGGAFGPDGVGHGAGGKVAGVGLPLRDPSHLLRRVRIMAARVGLHGGDSFAALR